MLQIVPREPSPEELEAQRDRRLRLVAALEHTGVKQAELTRMMIAAGEITLASTTVNRWVKGGAGMTEMTIRGILVLLGLEPDWRPPDGWKPAPPPPPPPPSPDKQRAKERREKARQIRGSA